MCKEAAADIRETCIVDIAADHLICGRTSTGISSWGELNVPNKPPDKTVSKLPVTCITTV